MSNLYGIGVGTVSTEVLGLNPIVTDRDPGANDIQGPGGTLKVGQIWINTLTNTSWQLTSLESNLGIVTAIWIMLGAQSGSGPVNFLTPDSPGPVSPVAGGITLAGTPSQITTVGSAGTITFEFPVSMTVPGSLTTTTGLSAGTTLSSTGATTLATSGASTNTFGNTTGATSVSIVSGTGGSSVTSQGTVTVDGAAASNINIGASLTSGNITIGGSGHTGVISVGTSTSSETVIIGNTAGTTTTLIRAGSGQIYLESGMNLSSAFTSALNFSVAYNQNIIFANTTVNTVTVLLEASPVVGRSLTVYDSGGNASINNIIINGNGNEIAANGTAAATKNLTTNWASMTLAFDGTFWHGRVVA